MEEKKIFMQNFGWKTSRGETILETFLHFGNTIFKSQFMN
jgi:hypothetical protein